MEEGKCFVFNKGSILFLRRRGDTEEHAEKKN
jgi:hypothetical protein